MVTRRGENLALTAQSIEGGPLMRAVLKKGECLPDWMSPEKERVRRLMEPLTEGEQAFARCLLRVLSGGVRREEGLSIEPSDVVRFIRQLQLDR
jgi:hypothetical protein